VAPSVNVNVDDNNNEFIRLDKVQEYNRVAATISVVVNNNNEFIRLDKVRE